MAAASDIGIKHQPLELRDYGDDAPLDEDDEGDVDPDAMSAMECSTEFFNMLVHVKVAGIISAKHACILSFQAKTGGLCDPGRPLALHPARVGGAFSKHFDKVVGLDKQMQAEFCKLQLPGFQRWSLDRTTLDVEASPVHSKLQEEIATTPDFWD